MSAELTEMQTSFKASLADSRCGREKAAGLPGLAFGTRAENRCPPATAMFGGQDQPSELQNKILTVYDRNPDMNARQIAERCDCSASYVNETIDEYRSGPDLF